MSARNATMINRGFLVPEWFHEQPVTDDVMNLSSVFLGTSLGVAVFSATKAVQQSWTIWKRIHRLNAYVIMIWIHWTANVLLGFISWAYLWGSIKASFWLWFFILLLWVAQVQLLVQIIINRISLLMINSDHARKLKIHTACLLTAINISVFCIWIPARLAINPTYIYINEIWDRIEKGIFLLVDTGLNGYFIYLVHTRLVANGLKKYNRLFRVNLVMIAIAISLDVVFIGLMSLPNTLVYLNFQSFAYLSKLHIEMNMADLIRKVVRASSNGRSDGETALASMDKMRGDLASSSSAAAAAARRTNNRRSGGTGGGRGFLATISSGHTDFGPQTHAHVELGIHEDTSTDGAKAAGPAGPRGSYDFAGIHRTIITEVVRSGRSDGLGDDCSSTMSSSGLEKAEPHAGANEAR